MVRSSLTRLAGALGVVVAASLLAAPVASATFHLMKIREISPGTNGQDDSFVEVQMYAPFQNFLANGAALLVCNSNCTPSPVTISPFANVASGDTQDTVVFGDSGLAAGSKDFTSNLNLDQIEGGGAVCYLSEPGFHDCVSWGNFSTPSTLTGTYGSVASPGAPAPALTSGMALRRSIQAGCPTLLEGNDDTNDSSADFSVTTPNPRPNSVAPTETPCSTGGAPPPAGGGTPSHKKKCKKAKKRAAAAKKCRKRK
jgi:hypothetical protein